MQTRDRDCLFGLDLNCKQDGQLKLWFRICIDLDRLSLTME